MPSISYNYRSKWSNYHLTRQGSYSADGEIRETANVHCSDIAGVSGPQRFASTGAELQKFVKRMLNPDQLIVQLEPPEAIVSLGRGWSFSALIGAKDMQIDLTGLAGISPAQVKELHQDCSVDHANIALASGGTRLRELVNWALPLGKSIKTAGTHLGPTIAGGFGTASHGSRIGYGGLQDQILGMHIITGEDSSVWIERASQPLLNDAAITQFSNKPAIRDDDIFADALIHLGGMGIVNGVAFELVPRRGYSVVMAKTPVNADWLSLIAVNNFRQMARNIGVDQMPDFYELTINPHDWDGPVALHTMYFETETPPTSEVPIDILRSSDAVIFAVNFFVAIQHQRLAGSLKPIAEKWLNNSLEQICQEQTIFALYASQLKDDVHRPQNMDMTYGWEQMHNDEITGGYPGALYNASYTIDAKDVEQVIPMIVDAVKHVPPTFLFTLRFVKNPDGTMAFTRFENNVVIEVDGISEKAPSFGPIGKATEVAALRVQEALTENGINFGMHWAKLGKLDRQKVAADYGPVDDPASPICRWRKTRYTLLDEQGQKLFWNDGLVNFGLIDKPESFLWQLGK